MNKININDTKALANPYKVGILATIDDFGDVHLTLISSLTNKGEDGMMFAEFVEGDSKRFIYERPETGFFIMGLDKNFWTGKMKFTHSVTEGEDYVMFNNLPLFRYNTYCGISVVHYADLIDISEKKALNMAGVIANAVRVSMFKGLVAGDKSKKVLRPWAQEFAAILGNLMFIGFKGDDGIPKVVPIIQGQSASSSRLAFTRAPYADMLKELKDGARVAVYCMDLDMQAIEVKGVFHEGKAGMCYVDIDKVYNPVPPKAGYVYPNEPHQTAVDWSTEPLIEELKA